jgi:hypothetical protein
MHRTGDGMAEPSRLLFGNLIIPDEELSDKPSQYISLPMSEVARNLQVRMYPEDPLGHATESTSRTSGLDLRGWRIEMGLSSPFLVR